MKFGIIEGTSNTCFIMDKSNLEKLGTQTPDRIAELNDITRNAIAEFRGLVPTLESAIGMLFVGDHLGWRSLTLIHSKRTLRKYEKILNIQVKEFFPEQTETSRRTYAYKASEKISNFWKAVSGEIKIDKRQEID